jgi:hypothetical protein
MFLFKLATMAKGFQLGVSHVTLARRMAEIEAKQGILLRYRSIQTLELTALQFRILEAITPQKIKDASLLDLLKAFGILQKAELGLKGEKYKIEGLATYQGTGTIDFGVYLKGCQANSESGFRFINTGYFIQSLLKNSNFQSLLVYQYRRRSMPVWYRMIVAISSIDTLLVSINGICSLR